MTILSISPLAAGNAVHIVLSPPDEAIDGVLLRKTDAHFTSYDDVTAVVVNRGLARAVIDVNALSNGTTYHYRPYWHDGQSWGAAPAKSVTPATAYIREWVDALSFLHQRLDLGLQALLAQGRLHHGQGRIPVLTAPPLTEGVHWPVVTLHLDQDGSAERGIGEELGAGRYDADSATVQHTYGWFSHVHISVMIWSQNPDERIALRCALKDIVIANQPVFNAAGLVNIDFQQSDSEDLASFNVPVYQALSTFTCLAPSFISTTADAINDVVVSMPALTFRQPELPAI